MITQIQVANVASYGKEVQLIKGLRRFNYVYGSNGSGKTTLGCIIADPSEAGQCKVTWKNDIPLKVMIYNRYFIDKNFESSAELEGVFTLGEESKETLEIIRQKSAEVSRHSNAIIEQQNALKQKETDLQGLETNLLNSCWEKKVEHEDCFKEALVGCLRKELFKNKIIESRSSEALLLTLDELKKKAEIVFGEPPSLEVSVAHLEFSDLLSHEMHPLLSKPILGRKDVAVSALIQKLGNGDWVGIGRTYLEKSDGKCPFCQAELSSDFEKRLADYFDDTFAEDSRAYSAVVDRYQGDAEDVQVAVDEIVASENTFAGHHTELLKNKKAVLNATINNNIALLKSKRAELSRSIKLESLSEILNEINELVDSINIETQNHNDTVRHLRDEQSTLKEQVWRYLTEELKSVLDTYSTQKTSIENTKKQISTRLDGTVKQRQTLLDEISALERQTTSIKPTLDAINQSLKSLGFESFSLAEAANNRYRLVRADGAPAKETLSEGERSFVTFLYFYHLLQGSISGESIAEPKVVVIDDPVSSMDSSVLFIVSSLIRELCREAAQDTSSIKQIFVLTHNVYFHKELTYGNCLSGGRSFWIVRKPNGKSEMVPYDDKNPIKTSYHLLWEEIFGDGRSAVSVQNAMRRILEHYFKTLGGIPVNDLPLLFEGGDKIVCKSLISWVHDGSHTTDHDWFVAADDECIEMYLRVFKGIFDHTQHSRHYEMMCEAVGVSKKASA